MKTSEKSPLGYYTIGIAALFLAGFLLLVVFGAGSFRDTAAGQNDNMSTRAILSYLPACVHAGDAAGAVSVREGEEGPVLVVADGDSGYALRIYCHQGNLVEDFSRTDAELSPENGQIIGPTDTFSVEERPGGVLSVETDEGRVLIHLRSGGDGP